MGPFDPPSTYRELCLILHGKSTELGFPPQGVRLHLLFGASPQETAGSHCVKQGLSEVVPDDPSAALLNDDPLNAISGC